jgi:hypothetical protein
VADLVVLKRIIDTEYADISTDSIISRGKLRAFLDDGSFIDVWFSLKITGRFSYHWERRHIDGSMYRHDNFPDINWQSVSTYPKHFHNDSQDAVEESYMDDNPRISLRQFMEFVRSQLAKQANEIL